MKEGLLGNNGTNHLYSGDRNININNEIIFNKNSIDILKNNNLLQYYILQFEEYFNDLGYDKHEGLPLVGIDNTILFTNSAIVSLKKYIVEGEKIPSYYITQPCIRVQNLDENINEIPLYMSSFNMIGVFISKEKYESFISEVWNFLLTKIDYKSNEIKVYCDSNHETLIEGWEKLENGPEIIYSDEDYTWKFGEGDKMKGKGISFRVLDKNKKFVDIGNIMEVISDGEVKGYALGLGVETLISKKNDYINPIQFFTDKAGIIIEDSYDIHLYDSLKILIDTYRNGLSSGRKSSGYELKKTFKKINLILSLSSEKYLYVFENIILLEKCIYGDNEVSKKIYDELIKRSNFEILNKSVSLLVDLGQDENSVLDNLKERFQNKIFFIKDIYSGNNISLGKKSVTLGVKYISEKGNGKNDFNILVESINKSYTIR